MSTRDLSFGNSSGARSGAPEQAVLIYLVGAVDQDDLTTLENELSDAIAEEALGEYDGHEFGPDGARLFMYSPDAESLYAGIEATLRDHPLCRNARVIVRLGQPGAPERQIRI